jgi:hypothetical protein
MASARFIEFILILVLISSICSMWADYKIDELNVMKEDNSLAALGKCLLAVDANMDHQQNEYEKYISESERLLMKYDEFNDDRSLWIIVRNIATGLAIAFNIFALILIESRKEAEK